MCRRYRFSAEIRQVDHRSSMHSGFPGDSGSGSRNQSAGDSRASREHLQKTAESEVNQRRDTQYRVRDERGFCHGTGFW
jgi:hypothetical protein